MATSVTLKPELLMDVWKNLLTPRLGVPYVKFPLLEMITSSLSHMVCFTKFLNNSTCVRFHADYMRIIYDQPFMGIKDTTVFLNYRSQEHSIDVYNLCVNYAPRVVYDE